MIRIYIYIGGWGILSDREIVSFRACVRGVCSPGGVAAQKSCCTLSLFPFVAGCFPSPL